MVTEMDGDPRLALLGRRILRLADHRWVAIDVLLAALFADSAIHVAASTGSYGGVSGAVTSSDAFSNTAYLVGSGPTQLREGVGSMTCLSAGVDPTGSAHSAAGGTCDAIDDFGARTDQLPGGRASATSITLTNVGSVSTKGASFVAGTCIAAAAHDYAGSDISRYCATVDVTIGNTTPGAIDKCVFPLATVANCPAPNPSGTLANLANRTLRNPALPHWLWVHRLPTPSPFNSTHQQPTPIKV
jgi:hypothetical protein